MVKFVNFTEINAYYLKNVMIKMNIGGVSNKSYSNRVKGLLFDFRAMRNNGILFPLVTLICKPARKIIQFI